MTGKLGYDLKLTLVEVKFPYLNLIGASFGFLDNWIVNHGLGLIIILGRK